MARKSRKYLQVNEPPKVKDSSYTVGGYIRVSEKGTDSIESQKMIIQNYIDEVVDISLKDFYIDDGVSSFFDNKPAFNKMMNDIEDKVINCVIVKDISRFTRDDLDAAAYIQKYFPII